MTRENMLKILGDLPYVVIWPNSWEDIGFTERELWINSLGYGYFLCDEINPVYWKGKGLDESTWNKIKPKLENKSLEYEDIKGTAIESLLNEVNYYEYDFEDKDELNNDLAGLLELKKGHCDTLYAMRTDSNPGIFDSESDFLAEYERDWADVYWEDMDDSLLIKWINRLVNETDKVLEEWSNRNKLNGDICLQDGN